MFRRSKPWIFKINSSIFFKRLSFKINDSVKIKLSFLKKNPKITSPNSLTENPNPAEDRPVLLCVINSGETAQGDRKFHVCKLEFSSHVGVGSKYNVKPYT